MNREEVEEIKRHFNVVAEGLEHKIQLVAEGHEVIRQEMREFREEVKEEFKEVKSMIKFSYAELDQGALRISNCRLRIFKFEIRDSQSAIRIRERLETRQN